MRVHLIMPNIGYSINRSGKYADFKDNARMEPLQLAAIAGVTPPDIELEMYDERCEELPYDTDVDLVAISVEIFAARRAYQIAQKYREMGVKVLLGGIHVSMVPDEAAEYADSILIGDGENIWQQVLEDLKNGALKAIYRGAVSCPAPGVYPDRSIYKGKKYLPLGLLQFGRGCYYGCSFCAISKYFDKQHYRRRVDEVIREIEQMDKKFLFFVDDNIVADIDAAKELFRALIPYNIKWVGQASIDMTRDKELMRLMEKSGCVGHVIGFEAVTQKGLKLLKKSPNIKEFNNYDEQIKILRDYGIQSWAAFTLGHDNEDMDSIKTTLDFALHHKFGFAAFNILMPYPSTPLYLQLEKEDRLLFKGKWWLDEDYRFNHAAFIPKNLSPDELTEACYDVRKSYNSYASIGKRLLKVLSDRKTMSRIAMLTKYSLLFRVESFKKQHMNIGMRGKLGNI
ncbi:MAG: radical SAM protein [Bacteroidetes bacterium]|nr:MAG: radical SAM protein [Bacteroidota bacterium]